MARKQIALTLMLILTVVGCQPLTSSNKEEGVTQAICRIEDEMQRKALAVGNDTHFASTIEQVQALEPEITIKTGDMAQFSRQYTVFTKGVLLGINKYEVGVRVSGLVTRDREGAWRATVTGVERTHDAKR